MKYLHYDVFTSEPLLGNQLAVFPDARGLTTPQMQAIARELNFSESTFIFPPERPDTDIRMRIFTPSIEMPMAGHPTVGSTFALAVVGVIERGRTRFTFGLNVGPTPVDLEWDGGRVAFVWMTQARPEFGPVVDDRAQVAASIGLSESDLQERLPLQQVSCGVPYLMVPVRDRAAVDRATPDPAALSHLPAFPSSHPAVFVFAFEGVRLKADSTPSEAYSRMFAPALGVFEDPATGSASGPLGCYLVKHGCVAGDEPQRIVSNQGVKMGRASRIHIAITRAADVITDVKVGGEAVLVARGEFLAVSPLAT
jgi:trans-2,3-dihydro-3-hydroxyanthranilate isomerase